MLSSEPLVDEARLAALSRAMPAKAFDRSVAAFRASLAKRVADAGSAIAGQDWDDVARIAHSIKGVSGNFGAQRLAAVSEALETMLAAGDRDTAPGLVAELTEIAALTEAALTEALTRIGSN